MKKSMHFLASGEVKEVKPLEEKFNLQELQGFVEGRIDIVPDYKNEGMVFIVHDEGMYTKSINVGVRKKFGKTFYGNVLWCAEDLIN